MKRIRDDLDFDAEHRAYTAGRNLFGDRIRQNFFIYYPFTGILGFIIGGLLFKPDNPWLMLLGIVLVVLASMIGLSGSRQEYKRSALYAGRKYLSVQSQIDNVETESKKSPV